MTTAFLRRAPGGVRCKGPANCSATRAVRWRGRTRSTPAPGRARAASFPSRRAGRCRGSRTAAPVSVRALPATTPRNGRPPSSTDHAPVRRPPSGKMPNGRPAPSRRRASRTVPTVATSRAPWRTGTPPHCRIHQPSSGGAKNFATTSQSTIRPTVIASSGPSKWLMWLGASRNAPSRRATFRRCSVPYRCRRTKPVSPTRRIACEVR